jgi:hypothetical protein
VKAIRQRQTQGACFVLQHPMERTAICNATTGPKPLYNIRRVCATEQNPTGYCPPSDNRKPIMQMITAPDCGGCDRMKAAVNRGTAARKLLEKFDVVHVHGPVIDWTARWKELNHEGMVPQTYFYTRDGRPLDVMNANFDPQFTHLPENSGHAFMLEEHLVSAMEIALDRDRRVAAGEDYSEVIANVPPQVAPSDFTDCAACVSQDGFGWSLKKNKCGRFANQRCPEL